MPHKVDGKEDRDSPSWNFKITYLVNLTITDLGGLQFWR